MNERRADITRTTDETAVQAALSLDCPRPAAIDSGVPFFDHMLSQTARHGRLGLTLSAKGDLHIDAHHTMEDCGIVLGRALSAALGDKENIRRFGFAYAPLDESLARAVVDLSGRPSLHYRVRLSRDSVGDVEGDLFREFFQSLVNAAGMALHIDLLHGVNAHHQIEAVFKSFGLALAQAVSRGDAGGGVPSTKGVL